MDPEAKARLKIDEKLSCAKWVVQDFKDCNPYAALGVAIREFPTNNGGEVDYALFINGNPVGVIEAKRDEEGVHLLTDTSEQNYDYTIAGLKGKTAEFDKKYLRFKYEATSKLTHFVDLADPKPRTRKVFSFYQPSHLQALLNERKAYGATLRGRLQQFPRLDKGNLYDCQYTAITRLEDSMGKARPRALIQMATGAGKTYTAVTSVYRMLKFAKVRRVLFLTDTVNLAEQAYTEGFAVYTPDDSTNKFTDIYQTMVLRKSAVSDNVQVCISTIQRLYAMLSGTLSDLPDEEDEDATPQTISREEKKVQYCAACPPEFFDVIIIDECHRSIYNTWKQVLEYFDAFLIGLTATPSQKTFAFFDKIVVSEYSHQEAVLDHVNVGSLGAYRIETEKNKNGGKVEKIEMMVKKRDKRTRQEFWDVPQSDEELNYVPSDLDRAVVNESEIRTVLETMRDQWHELPFFREREEIPKTLIFAKDDSHADDIVRITREVFDEGDDFCKKITYRSEAAEKDQSLIFSFRNKFNPRIAVTVNKIATGTDVKPIEMLLFMRDIKSENYYEQMLGRARRTLSHDKLREVSPSAVADKMGYVIFDAVGVTESPKTQGRTKVGGDARPRATFKQLLQNLAIDHSPEALDALGNRLQHLGTVISSKDSAQFTALTEGKSLSQVTRDIVMAYDETEIAEQTKANHPEFDKLPGEEQQELLAETQSARVKTAIAPLLKPEVRKFLLTLRGISEQTIDPALDHLIAFRSVDSATTAGIDVRTLFQQFITEQRDTTDALQIIFNIDYRHRPLAESVLLDLCEKMKQWNSILTQKNIFLAYKPHTKNQTLLGSLTDLVSIIRYEYGQTQEIIPFADTVRQRFKDWIFARNSGKGQFTPEQTEWLQMIRDFIAANGAMTSDVLKLGIFASKGGATKHYRLFGSEWETIITELNAALVA